MIRNRLKLRRDLVYNFLVAIRLFLCYHGKSRRLYTLSVKQAGEVPEGSRCDLSGPENPVFCRRSYKE